MSKFKNLVLAEFQLVWVSIILEPASFAFDFNLTRLIIAGCAKTR